MGRPVVGAHSRLTVLALALTFGGVVACSSSAPSNPAPTRSAQSASTPTTPNVKPSKPANDNKANDSDARGSDKDTSADSKGNASKGRGRQTIVVTRIIDGDTFEARGLGQGPVPHHEVDVRMLEIDTVEEGQCGYEASTDKLASLLGQKVKVERDQELKDQYGRWLLYVWSGGVFVNLEMVEEGWAEAVLYEPNDKYWNKINAADTSDTYTPWPPCDTPEPQQQEQEEDDDSGGAYVFPPPPPDKDCGSVSAENFQVRPGDPHNFDADGDGTGCETGGYQPQQEEEQTSSGYAVPPPPPDRDCSEVSATNFRVRPGDPHNFDGDGDGMGCES